ncbi:MAG TPA: DUF5684 domain-containing protein [Bacteroidales bacterium]|nr:DUF5684 domain-containing protein [Bacteroidales bacterium]
MGTIVVIYVALFVLMIVSMWKIFTKAGKPGWACIIPIYNIIVLLEIVGKPWWWLLLMLLPVVNFVLLIWVLNLLSKSYGHEVGFTLGLIFLSFIFIPILGLGESKYVGPAGKAQAPAAPPAA